jgi:transposase-like protein
MSTEDVVTKTEIKETIEATKIAISTKVGSRAKYPLELKTAILKAVNAIGSSHFSRKSGLDPSLISQWRRPLRGGMDETKNLHARVDLSQCRKRSGGIESGKSVSIGRVVDQTNRPRVREIEIAHAPIPSSHSFAIIRADNLEIQVPVSVLTPAWILEVVRGLGSGKVVNHV